MLSNHKQWVSEVFDRAAPQYGGKSASFFTYFGKRLVEQVNVMPNQHILDVATGRGAVLFPLANAVGPLGKVVGIDISQQMLIETQKEILKKNLSWVDLQCMDAERLNFLDDSFDFVFCGFAMFFLPSIFTALSEFRRVLKPGGMLAISTWGEDSKLDTLINEAIRQLCPASSLAITPFWGEKEISTCLKEAGFKDMEIVKEIKTFSHCTPREWWDSLWSHGTRAKFEQLTTNQIADLRKKMLKEASESNEGQIDEDLHVFYAKAKKAL